MSEQERLDVMTNRSLDGPSIINVPEDWSARAIVAQSGRVSMAAAVPGVHELSDAEVCDSFYYTLFPNFHPWGAYNRIIYRFRPNGNDAQSCLMEVYFISPFRGKRPKPAAYHLLGEDEDWTSAPELGFLGRVFNQDTYNLGRVQSGLRGSQQDYLNFGNYQESKIRHFHSLLERQLEL